MVSKIDPQPLQCEPNQETEVTDSRSVRAWNDPSRFEENTIQASYVSGALGGIMLAGSVYPFAGFMSLLFFDVFFVDVLIGGIEDSIFTAAKYIPVAATVGLITSCFTGLISIALIIVINRSLGNPLDARSAAISAGSLAGYMPTAWTFFSTGVSGVFVAEVALCLSGPILAMSLGAIGAAWASARFGGVDFTNASKRKKRRISIFHLMAATTWVAITFAIANYFGGLGFAVVVAGWFVLQAIMLGFIHFFRVIMAQGQQS